MQYKVLSTLAHLGDRHVAGSIIDLTEDEARAFGDEYVEAVTVAAVTEPEAKAEETTPEPEPEKAVEPEKSKGVKSNKK